MKRIVIVIVNICGFILLRVMTILLMFLYFGEGEKSLLYNNLIYLIPILFQLLINMTLFKRRYITGLDLKLVSFLLAFFGLLTILDVLPGV